MHIFYKIRYKLLLSIFLLLVITLLAVGLVIHDKAQQIITNQSVIANDKLIDNGIENIELFLKELNDVYKTLYLNDSFRNILKRKANDAYYNQTQDYYSQIKSVLLSMVSTNSEVFSVIYVDSEGQLIYSTRDEAGIYKRYDELDLPPDYVKLISDSTFRHQLSIIPPTEHIKLKNKPSNKVFTIARRVVNTEAQFKPLGIMFITLEADSLDKITNLLSPYQQAEAYIIRSDGYVFYDTEKSKIGTKVEPIINELLNDKQNLTAITLNNQKYIVSKAYSQATDFWIVLLIPEIIYSYYATDVTNSMLVITVMALGIAVLLSLGLAAVITRPVERLAVDMDKIEVFSLNQRVTVKGHDEISRLGTSFNKLLEKLETSIHNEYIMNIKQKDATIRALQAQLNPHFLYNVLQSIASIAALNKVTEVTIMAKSLGAMFRYAIESDQTTATLGEEIGHVQSYIAIQKIRFGNRIKNMIDIPDYLLDYKLPRVSLQPMVENSIQHGFSRKLESSQGMILISGFMKQNYLVVEISDDGFGFDEQVLADIFEDFRIIDQNIANINRIDKKKTKGIGLQNLYSRLKILYNGEARLIIETEAGIGTSISIMIPVERGIDV